MTQWLKKCFSKNVLLAALNYKLTLYHDKLTMSCLNKVAWLLLRHTHSKTCGEGTSPQAPQLKINNSSLKCNMSRNTFILDAETFI